MIPSRSLDRILVVSDKKQAAYGTLVSDANLQVGKRFSPRDPVFGQPESRWWTNRELAMKGHDYSSERREVERDYAESLSLEGDSYLLAWAFAFALGKLTSVQPNAGGNPTAWRHTIKPLDPAADGKDLPVTTLYIEAANVAGLKRRMHACHVREASLEFPPGSPLQLSLGVTGSGQYTSGALATPPSLAVLNLPLSNNMLFNYGVQAAPADITSEIVRGSVRFGFSWNFDDENSRQPGGGLYRSRAWVGKPQLTLEFQRFVDDADAGPQTDYEAGTVREVKVKCTGPVIGAGPEVHDIEVRGLAVRPEVLRLGRQGDKTIWQYTIGPDNWFKEGSNDVVTVIVTNLQTSYLST